jgi:hypothetical protein
MKIPDAKMMTPLSSRKPYAMVVIVAVVSTNNGDNSFILPRVRYNLKVDKGMGSLFS